MKIENLDDVLRLSTMRDKLISMKHLISKDNAERRIRVQLHDRPDDCWDVVSSDDRLLELVDSAINIRLEEIEREIMEIE